MRMSAASLVITLLAAPAVCAAQDREFDNGLFISTGRGPIELFAYAEKRTNGNLVMVHGTLEDVPRVDTIISILVSMPLWRPAEMLIASDRIFHDDYYERVVLRFAQSRLSLTATGVRVSDVERRDRIDRLLKTVKASAKAPGYLFVILQLDGVNRYYPVRLDRELPQ
jgi:hypothetical protein